MGISRNEISNTIIITFVDTLLPGVVTLIERRMCMHNK